MDKLGYSSDSDEEETQQSIAIATTTSTSTSLPPLPDAIKHYTHPHSSTMKLRYNILSHIPPGMLNCYTYAEFVPTLPQCDALQEIVRNVNMVFKYAQLSRPTPVTPTFQNKLGLVTPLHVSLTENFYLSRELKDQFKKEVSQRIPSLSLTSAASTRLTFDKVSVVPNNNASSIFAVLSLDRPSKQRIAPLFEMIQQVMKDLQQQEKLFDGIEITSTDELHCSFAICEDQFSYKVEDLQELNELCQDLEVDSRIGFAYDTVKIVEQGNGRFSIKLY